MNNKDKKVIEKIIEKNNLQRYPDNELFEAVSTLVSLECNEIHLDYIFAVEDRKNKDILALRGIIKRLNKKDIL